MPATIHFIEKATGTVYGPHREHSIAEIDDMIADKFGFEKKPDKWASPWYTQIAYALAMNVSLADLWEAFYENEDHFPGWGKEYKVPDTLRWLMANFWIETNWGKDSKIKELGQPPKPRKVKA